VYSNIPAELKQYRQWVVWILTILDDGKTTKIPYCPRNGMKASPTDPSNWGSFDDACAALQSNLYSGIGFVLSDADPYTFIDLDDPYAVDQDGERKYPNPEEIGKRQIEIYENFNTYIERSPSGKGLHVIVKGKVDSGRKREAIEIYSTGRYMTMTGDVIKQMPVADYQDWAASLWAYLAPPKPAFDQLNTFESQPEKYTDQQICDMAYSAKDGPKFFDLYTGHWHEYYPSQSEADFSLCNIIAFYTDNKEQVKRIFWTSQLGQRPKGHRPDYVKWLLDKSFDRKIPMVNLSLLKQRFEEQMADKPVEKAVNTATNPYVFPPGLVGDIAEFIFAQAAYPAKEIALAASLAFMSGVCGRTFNVSGTGLNNYIVLLAKTGRGKEAMARGIDKLFGELKKLNPAALDFCGPAEFASPQGLNKQLSQTPCFISILGEFSLLLEQLNSKKASPAMAGLRRMFLDLYNKSGHSQVMKGVVYSDRDKNVKSVAAPAFTFLGECTPEKYYSLLDDGIASEGFLPRLTTIEFLGDRVEQNENAFLVQPDHNIIARVADIMSIALMRDSNGTVQDVLMDDEAVDIFRKYDKKCGIEINRKDVHSIHNEMWTRANVKAMKLAAIVSVGINHINPLITKDCANWAINIINYDNKNVIDKFENGEVGCNNLDSEQIKKFKEFCKFYLNCQYKELGSMFKEKRDLHKAKIIPSSYLQSKCINLGVFRNDHIGATGAFRKTLQSMIDSGFIQEINAIQSKKFGTSSKCYVVVGEL